MSEARTIADELLRLASADGAKAAILSKRYGRWIPRSRAEVAEATGEVAAGLRSLDVTQGDVAALLLAPNSAWVFTDLGVQVAGLRAVALPVGTAVDVIGDVLADAGARVVFVQRVEVAELVLGLADEGRLPKLRHVVYVDAAAVAEYVDPRLRSLDDLRAGGREGGGGLDALEKLAAERDPAEVAALAYDAGAEGAVRCVALTHAALLAAARATVEAFELGERDRVLAVRPMGDPVERGATIYPALLAGAVLALPETAATVDQALYEIAPTYIHVTTRWVRDVANRVHVLMQTAKGTKGAVNRWWFRSMRRGFGGGKPRHSWLQSLLVARPVGEKLGLNRARHVVVSGAPLPAEALVFFRALGVPLRPAYGPADAGGLVTADRVPLPGFEVRVGEGDVVEFRNPADTWRRSDDVGALRDGRLTVTDRVGEELDVGGGTLRPGRLETALRSSPYLQEAVLGSEGHRVILAVELAPTAVSRWAAHKRLRYTTYASLTRLPEVRELTERAVRATLDGLDAPAVDEIRILDRPLTQAGGDLTATGRARRGVLWQAAAADDAVAR